METKTTNTGNVSPNTVIDHYKAALADTNAQLERNKKLLEAKDHELELLRAAVKPGTEKLAQAFKEELIAKLHAGLTASKKRSEAIKEIEKFASDAMADVQKVYSIEGKVAPVVVLDKRKMRYAAIGAGFAAAAIGGVAFALGHKRGHRRGAQQVVESELKAWRGSDNELHMQMNDPDQGAVHVMFEKVPEAAE